MIYNDKISEICYNNSPKRDSAIGAYDVLCGRNKAAFNNVGNRRFRVLVSISLHEYIHVASRRKEKSQVVRNIIAATNKSGGRFLQEKNGVLVELSDREAQVKVGHAIRDMVIAKAKTQSNELSKIKSKKMNVKFSKIRRMSSLLAVQYQNITSHSNFAPDDECSLYDYDSFEPIPLNSIVSESSDKYIDSMMDSFVMDDNFVKDLSEDFHVSGLEELLELNLDESFSPRMGELLMKHLIE